MKKIKVEKAVGMVLCHDITKIIPGEFKGQAFKKGDVIREQDIPDLLRLGKRHIFVWEYAEGTLHENEAALRIATAAANGGVTLTEPKEGKVNLVARRRGLLKVNADALEEVNDIEQVVLSTMHNHQVVDEGDVVAGTRVIPLVISEEKIKMVEQICRNVRGLVEVKAFQEIKVGIVTTGYEVYSGKIEDKFGPVVKSKLAAYNSVVLDQVIVPDDRAKIADAIKMFIKNGAELIITTGGMSVDPDDSTPAGIRSTGAVTVTYGAPVLPGSMLLLAYLDGVPILGLPGCVMYSKTTIFDLLLPRIMAGEKISRREIVRLGHGGLCHECQDCRYPSCSFGKGA
ncbi:MAG: molybdopterin-binding protein [Bacillota bacterium]